MADGNPPLAYMNKIFDAFVAFDEVVESANVQVLALSAGVYCDFADGHEEVDDLLDFPA